MKNATFRALALAALLPAVAAAQAIPSPTSAKRAAQNAANKTSAAIAASQNTETQTQAKQPAAPQTKTTTAAPQTKTTTPQTKTATTPPQTKTATPQTKTAAPQTKAATPAQTKTGTAGPQPAARSPQQTTPPAPVRRPEVVLVREVYDYRQEGRRDPFLSLVSSSELRPTISDLKLVAVAHDAAGRNSVAIMRDVKTNEQYRVKVGQTLGRMRVAQIQPKAVVFSIEEFGYNRQEILALGDTTRARTP